MCNGARETVLCSEWSLQDIALKNFQCCVSLSQQTGHNLNSIICSCFHLRDCLEGNNVIYFVCLFVVILRERGGDFTVMIGVLLQNLTPPFSSAVSCQKSNFNLF